jgi:hypothetical protein
LTQRATRSEAAADNPGRPQHGVDMSPLKPLDAARHTPSQSRLRLRAMQHHPRQPNLPQPTLHHSQFHLWQFSQTV